MHADTLEAPEQDVVRLHIAVHDTPAMGLRQRRGELRADVGGPARRERTLGDQLRERRRHPVGRSGSRRSDGGVGLGEPHVLHHEPGMSLLVEHDVVEGHDVFVAQARCGLGLTDHLLALRRVRWVLRLLERDPRGSRRSPARQTTPIPPRPIRFSSR